MKKQYKILSAVIVFAMLFSGCAGENAERDSEPTESTASADSSDNAAAQMLVKERRRKKQRAARR